MKKIINLALASIAAIAMIASPIDVYAQARRGGGSSSSSASHSSSPSRSSSSASRSSSPSRSSGGSSGMSSSRSSGSSSSSNNVSRSSGPSRSAVPSTSVSRSSAPVRSGSSSVSRSSAPVRSGSNSISHSSAPSVRKNSPAHRSAPSGVRFQNSRRAPVHPQRRDFIHHDAPVHFMHHGPHYFGYRVHTIPHGYLRHVYWGRPYYLYNGIYYRAFNNYFVVCRPPYGVFFHPSVVDIALSTVRFAFYCDLWHDYHTIDSNWATIEQQNRIIAQNNALIASQNAAITASRSISDESSRLALSLGLVQSYADASVEYYYEDGVFFVMDAKGEYKVIVPPAGALVNSLPEDYAEVTLGGKVYYQVDDTIYRTKIVDGSACFEVLGQIPS